MDSQDRTGPLPLPDLAAVQDTETFLGTAGAVLGHIWSASGSVWPRGQAGGTSQAVVCSVADDELMKLQ